MASIIPVDQQVIDDFKQTGLLKLGKGEFSIDQTIDLGTMIGVRVEGAGTVYATTHSGFDKQITKLIWAGTPGEPMIKGQIRHGLFQDIQFQGAKIWIQSRTGLGTGLCQFNRVCFNGADAGVKFGDVVNANAADSKFNFCEWVNCDSCIELSTSQNVNYGVSDSLFYRCNRVFDIPAGGLINFDNCYMIRTPIVFDISGDGSKVGSQNANFSVTNIRYDAQQDVKPKIVKDTGSYGTNRKLFVLNEHAPPIGLDYVDTASATWVVQGLNVSKVEIMSTTPQSGEDYTFHVSMISKADGTILMNPTLEQADFNITTDGGALIPLTNMPTVKPTNSGIVEIQLTPAEVGTESFTVVMKDSVDDEWRSMNYHESVSDLTTVTQPVMGTHTTSIIAAPVQANIVDLNTLDAELITNVLEAELVQ